MSYYSEVVQNINEYFEQNLNQYEVVEVRNKSIYPEDYYLYMVCAKKKVAGSYAVFTSWNNETLSLNHGHYGLKTLEECEKVFQKYYNSGK